MGSIFYLLKIQIFVYKRRLRVRATCVRMRLVDQTIDLPLFKLLEAQFKIYHAFIQSVFVDAKHEDIVLELYASILNNLPIKETVKHLIDQDKPRDSFLILSTTRYGS